MDNASHFPPTISYSCLPLIESKWKSEAKEAEQCRPQTTVSESGELSPINEGHVLHQCFPQMPFLRATACAYFKRRCLSADLDLLHHNINYWGLGMLMFKSSENFKSYAGQGVGPMGWSTWFAYGNSGLISSILVPQHHNGDSLQRCQMWPQIKQKKTIQPESLLRVPAKCGSMGILNLDSPWLEPKESRALAVFFYSHRFQRVRNPIHSLMQLIEYVIIFWPGGKIHWQNEEEQGWSGIFFLGEIPRC